MVLTMLKWFTQLFADDPYHFFEPDETKGLFKHVLKWAGLTLVAIAYTIYAVVLEFVIKPAAKFATGIDAALKSDDTDTDVKP